jgi:galactose oxidase
MFHAGPAKQMHWITTSGNGSIVKSILRGDDLDAMNGNAVNYDIGKLLTLGGAQNYDDGPGSKRAYVIDINGSEATVKRTANDMQFGRTLVNSVVLPSGEVVVIGGQTAVKLFSDDFAVLEAEIWNPATERFTTLSKMLVARTYHSVALLLKDGRVWASGRLRGMERGCRKPWCCCTERQGVLKRNLLVSSSFSPQVADSAVAVLPITWTLKY